MKRKRTDDEEIEEMVRRTTTARKAITDKEGTKRPIKDIIGAIDCPVCKSGKLLYSICCYNGHIHAQCSTDKCVSWME